MSRRPRIAVTGPQEGGLFAWLMTWLALRRQGAQPILVRPGSPEPPKGFDALILGGGSDIDPESYGAELQSLDREDHRRPLAERIWSGLLFVARVAFSIKRHRRRHDKARDELEQQLCRQALAEQLPILGICRGAQLLNITMGGSLFQDTDTFYTETPHIKTLLPRKKIDISPDSRLAAILQTSRCRVNSLHDQAINKLGRQLTVSARDANGIVQAIEHTSHDFVIGVQWHPEYLPQHRRQQRLFQALVETSRCPANRA